MARVGILGGTFDPPHRVHVEMARAALDHIPLDRVFFMPAPRPPHKIMVEMTEYETRVHMVELAIAGEAGLELSRFEERREGPSYTAEMLREYRRSSADEVFLIVGSDRLHDLPRWRSPEMILELATLVVFPRPGFSSVLSLPGEASIVLFEEPSLDISSTEIRERARAGLNLRSMLPERVRKFILDNRIYS